MSLSGYGVGLISTADYEREGFFGNVVFSNGMVVEGPQVTLWSELLRRWGDLFAVCRMGDDLGFKTSMLIRPELASEHVVPQYRRVIGLVHQAGKPFLWHSCGVFRRICG